MKIGESFRLERFLTVTKGEPENADNQLSFWLVCANKTTEIKCSPGDAHYNWNAPLPAGYSNTCDSFHNVSHFETTEYAKEAKVELGRSQRRETNGTFSGKGVCRTALVSGVPDYLIWAPDLRWRLAWPHSPDSSGYGRRDLGPPLRSEPFLPSGSGRVCCRSSMPLAARSGFPTPDWVVLPPEAGHGARDWRGAGRGRAGERAREDGEGSGSAPSQSRRRRAGTGPLAGSLGAFPCFSSAKPHLSPAPSRPPLQAGPGPAGGGDAGLGRAELQLSGERRGGWTQRTRWAAAAARRGGNLWSARPRRFRPAPRGLGARPRRQCARPAGCPCGRRDRTVLGSQAPTCRRLRWPPPSVPFLPGKRRPLARGGQRRKSVDGRGARQLASREKFAAPPRRGPPLASAVGAGGFPGSRSARPGAVGGAISGEAGVYRRDPAARPLRPGELL
ncbi:uncharacterized protein RHO17_012336 [Thomomys bottae]